MTINFDDSNDRYKSVIAIMDGKKYVEEFDLCTYEQIGDKLTIVNLETFELKLREESNE